MSRTLNADQFWVELGKLRHSYEDRRMKLLGEMRLRLAGAPEKRKKSLEDAEAQALEAHVRRYFVDGFLRLLNWRLGTESEAEHELVPEAPVSSPSTKTVRFLDYLGFETRTLRPLLVVETKRPSVELKSLIPRARSVNRQKISDEIVRRINEPDYSGEWGQWLADLRDYAAGVSAKGEPSRLVITNGDWLIVWVRPACFKKGDAAAPGDFIVISDKEEMAARAHELFGLLEHGRVLGAYESVDLGILPHVASASSVECAMKGALVARFEHETLFEVRPAICLTPMVFLRSEAGAWLRVRGAEKEYRLPHNYGDLPGHVAEIEAASAHLHEQVCAALGKVVPLRAVTAHYDEASDFFAMPSVTKWGAWSEGAGHKFAVAVGEHGHFLRSASARPLCPYHSWKNAKKDGVAQGDGPQITRESHPRSFFVDDEDHRCFHSFVASSKSAPVDRQFTKLCGWRSAEPNGAFCEVWRLETGLCCRACSFEPVCTRTQAFRIPCAVEPGVPAPSHPDG